MRFDRRNVTHPYGGRELRLKTRRTSLFCFCDVIDDEEARRTKQQLSELGMKLMTRIRKVNPKTNDADGHAVKAYIKVIALFLLWHQSSKKSYGGAEERLVAAAKSVRGEAVS